MDVDVVDGCYEDSIFRLNIVGRYTLQYIV